MMWVQNKSSQIVEIVGKCGECSYTVAYSSIFYQLQSGSPWPGRFIVRGIAGGLQMLRKLIDRDGTPTVSLDKDVLELDGVMEDGEIPDNQRVHVQRRGQGVYVVRAVDENGIPELPEALK